MCPPVLVGTQCVLWADTQVRPYSELHVSLYDLLCQQRTPVVSQRYVPSRDARKCLVGGRPSLSKATASITCVPTTVIRRLVLQRTHRSCVPTGSRLGASLQKPSRCVPTSPCCWLLAGENSTLARYNNLELIIYQRSAMSEKSDFHVRI